MPDIGSGDDEEINILCNIFMLDIFVPSLMLMML